MPARDDELEARLKFDREKWQAEERLRGEELSLKREELKRSRWINPLVIAIFAAAAAALGNAVVTLINSTKQLELEDKRAQLDQGAERSKSEAARILEVVKANNPDLAATNLKFLIDTGLISNTEVKKHIQAYLDKRVPGEGIVLPAASPTRPGIERESWVAVGFLEAGPPSDINFTLPNGQLIQAPLVPNTTIKAKWQVNIRPGPAVWDIVEGTVNTGQCFLVQESRTLSAGARRQVWARGSIKDCA